MEARDKTELNIWILIVTIICIVVLFNHPENLDKAVKVWSLFTFAIIACSIRFPNFFGAILFTLLIMFQCLTHGLLVLFDSIPVSTPSLVVVATTLIIYSRMWFLYSFEFRPFDL